jgi:glycolate oxidase iron-sulfur subunit
MISEHIRNIDADLASCMKCGFCKAVCPVFLEEETTSPRAKVQLARAVARGAIELGPGIKRQMGRCLNCRACAEECPSGVEPNKIALAMRCAVVERDGLPLVKKLVFRDCLPSPRMMALGSCLIGLAQRVSGIESQNNPLRNLLPLIGMRKDKEIPTLGKRSLFSILPEVLEPFGERKTTVVYFPGCATNLIFPEVGLAAVDVLRKLGARVVIPHDLVCCSTPALNSGDMDGARALARRNIEIISRIDADMVITACGSCGLTIKREWLEVLGLSEAESIASKVRDIHQFVADYTQGGFDKIDDMGIVTYHDSCHLRRGLGVYREPRQLLKAILGDRFVEMEQADRCCGGGGTFSLDHPDLSQVVAETKMKSVAKSGAETVVAGCPGCVMQLRDSIKHRQMSVRALHSIEIINSALRG